MPRRALLILLACSRILPSAFAEGLKEVPAFRTAQQALADGLPDVAAVKAGRLLEDKSWSKSEQKQLATFAAEAWARAGRAAELLALAEAIGVTRQTIIAIEQGRYSPSLESAFRISRVFGVDVESVFGWSADPAGPGPEGR